MSQQPESLVESSDGDLLTQIARSPVRLSLVTVALIAAIEVWLWLFPEPGGKWSVRVAGWSAVLLFANLIVLWWYAKRTEQNVRLFSVAQRQANKPIVTIDYRPDDSTSGGHYWIRNVGPGVSINVWLLSFDNGCVVLESIGALGPHDSRHPPSPVRVALEHRTAVIVCAEGLVSRTAQWTVTVSARGGASTKELSTHLCPLSEETTRSLAHGIPLPFNELLRSEWRSFSDTLGCPSTAPPLVLPQA